MKIEVSVSTRVVGSRVKEIIELPDDTPEDEIEEYARETMFEMIEWNWRETE
jgi:hypothetical protein